MTAAAIYAKEYRLAQHYLHKLRKANYAYIQGSTIYGLKLVEQDWAQIQQGYSWSVTQAKTEIQAASLCSAYPYEAGELLELMLTPQEHHIWRQSALVAARQIGDQQAELSHLLALTDIFRVLGQVSEGIEYGQQALQLAQHLDAPREIATAFLLLGNLVHVQEKHAQAIQYLEQALRYFRSLHHQKGLAKTCFLLGHIMRYSGHPQEADEYYQQAIDLYRQVADPRGLAAAQIALKMSLLGAPTKQQELAASISEDYIQVFEKMGDRLGTAHMLQLFAYIRYHAGDIASGNDYWRKSIKVTRQLGAISLTVIALYNLGIDALIMDNFAEAIDHLTEAETIFRQLNNEPKIAHISALLSMSYWGIGDTENAYKFLCEALPRAYALSFKFGIAISLTAAAAYRLLVYDPQGCSVLIGVIENYPHTTWDIKEYALPKLRRAAEAMLDSITVEAAIQLGCELDFDTVVTDLIAALQP